MKKVINFLIMIALFGLNNVSYADRYGDFIEPLDSVINGGNKVFYSDENLKRYRLAYNETVAGLKEVAKTAIISGSSNCFGFDEVVDCTPIYCSRLKFLCDKENSTLKNAINDENIKSLDSALEECGLSENQFKYYLSDECF